MRALACLLILFLGGCADSTAVEPPQEDPTPEAERRSEPPAPDLPEVVTTNLTEVAQNLSDEGKVVVYHVAGHFDPGVATWVMGSGWALQDNVSLPFPVGMDATGVVAELIWDDPVQDIDLHLQLGEAGEFQVACEFGLPTDGCDEGWLRAGSLGAPDSPAAISYGGLLHQSDCASPPGTFSCDNVAWADAYSITVRLDFDIYVSVFYGHVPPSGYSAVDN